MTADASLQRAREWHKTAIIDIAPGKIEIRGYPIQELIGEISFPAMIWLMLRGELPAPAQARLLEAVLVAAVDHGPQAPAIAIARMAITCGTRINSAIASGVNVLGDVHGGAGAECMQLLRALRDATDPAFALGQWQRENGKYVPGFGHRFHPVDPRAVRLGALVETATRAGAVGGAYWKLACTIQALLEGSSKKPIPLNIDGITAVCLSELGFEPELGRAVFILSRSVGICAHAWEQSQLGGRIKGPTPPDFGFDYLGPQTRHLGDPVR